MDLEYYKKGFRIAGILCLILSVIDLWFLFQLATGICQMN